MRNVAAILLFTALTVTGVAAAVGFSVLGTVTRNQAEIKVDPEFAAAIRETAAAPEIDTAIDYIRSDEYDRALEILDRVVTDDDAFGLVVRGVALRFDGQDERAIRDLDRAIELDPGEMSAYAQRAVATQDRAAEGWAEESAIFARKAIKVAPNEPWPHVILGNSLIGLQQFDEAIAEFRLAIELDPVPYDAWAGVAQAFAEQGEIAKARAAIEQAKLACEHQSDLDDIAWVDDYVDAAEEEFSHE